jgi:hypothetical protein
MPDPWTHALPPDTRAVGTGDPANDADAFDDALTALGALFSIENPAFAGGADPSGSADSYPAISAAITAAVAAGGGTITVPPGTYKVNTAIPGASGVRIMGPSRFAATIFSTASSVFNMSPGSLIDGMEIDHLALTATGHDIFSGANVARCHVHDCTLTQNSAGNAIWNDQAVTLMVECMFRLNTEIVAGATRSIAAWSLNSQSNAQQVNANLWEKNVCFNNGADATQYFMQIISSGAATANLANTFRDLTFENPLGGMIDLQSAGRSTLENCLGWDTTGTIANSLIRLRKNATSSLPTRGTRVSNCGRAASGSVLGGGISDIQLDINCVQTLIERPVLAGVLDLGGSTGVKIIGIPASLTVNGAATTATAGANAGTGPPAPVIHPGPTNESGFITFGTGTTPAAGAQVNVTFGTPFNAIPTVVLTPGTAGTANLFLAASSVTAAGFNISTGIAPAASQANTTYIANWHAAT